MALSKESERLLLHAACADSYHDFSHPPKQFGNTFNPTREHVSGKPGLWDVRLGLPTDLNIPLSRNSANQYNPNVLHKENQMLQELFKGAEPIGADFDTQYKVPNPLDEDKKFVKRLCVAIASSPSIDGEKKVKRNFNTLLGAESYTIKLLSDSTGNTNVNEIQSLQAATSGKHAGREFRPSQIKVSDLFRLFKSNEVNLVFDACSMNVTSLFKNAQPDTANKQAITVNWLINREFLNDPATKPMNDDPKIAIFAKDQMKFNFLVEADPSPITYIRYESGSTSDVLQRNKFFSLLDFKLGPVSIKDNKSNPSTRLEIFQGNNTNGYFSDSPNIHNQIGECCKQIWDAMTGSDHIATSAHYQRKRSGDWLQALSCLDTGRLYYDRTDVNRTSKALTNKNIVLVTHDRILLWYALMQGLDVLFAGGKGLEEADGEDEDAESDEDADSPSSSKSGPKLYLMYFSNDKRQLSKDAIDAANFASAEAIIPKMEQLVQDVGVFNKNLDEIMQERAKNLEIKFDGVINSKKVKIIDLLKEFIRYSALDYTPADLKEILAVKARLEGLLKNKSVFVAKKGTGDTADYNKLLSTSLLFISLFNNLRLRMDTLSSKDAIKTSDNFARDSAVFNDSNLPILSEPFIKTSARRETPESIQRNKNEQSAIVRLAALITGSIDTDKLRQLREYLDGTVWNANTGVYVPTVFEEGVVGCVHRLVEAELVKKGSSAKLSDTNLYIISSAIFSKLNDVALVKPAQALLNTAIEEIVKDNVEPVLETVVVPNPELVFDQATFDKREKARLAGTKSDEEKVDIVNTVAQQNYERAVALADAAKLALDNATATLEQKTFEFNIDDLTKLQKKSKARRTPAEKSKIEQLIELRTAIELLSEEIKLKDEDYNSKLVAAENLKPSMFVPVVPKPKRSIRLRITNFFSVGPTLRSWADKAMRFFKFGGGGGVKADDKNFWAKILYVSYLNELITAMNGFDTENNLDYKYFEGLSRLVISHLDVVGKQNIDYKKVIQFLYNEIPTGKWSERGDYATFTAVAGSCISLKAIDKMDGSVPDFGYKTELFEQTAARYETYVKICKGLPFIERQRLLVSRLAKHIDLSTFVPAAPVVEQRNFSKMPLDFFEGINKLSPNDYNKLVAKSNLSPVEMNSFMKAYRAALPKLNKPVIQNVNRRQTVNARFFGGKETRKVFTKAARKTKKNKRRSTKKPKAT